jgi:methylmalonyl-CoA mutase cobalamin-binding subunit
MSDPVIMQAVFEAFVQIADERTAREVATAVAPRRAEDRRNLCLPLYDALRAAGVDHVHARAAAWAVDYHR